MPPFVHHPDYDATSVPDDHRFPMRKYTLVARKLMERGLVGPSGWHVPEPASRDLIALAHGRSYVDAVFDLTLDRASARTIGFEMTPHVVRRAAASAGGTLLTARLALAHGAAANTAGGSHHAGPDAGAGFCVFNDVGVAARALLAEGAVSRILVADADVHHGDGTARMFADDARVFTWSIHCADNWPREKPPSDLDTSLPRGAGDDAYLAAFSAGLAEAMARSRPQLVFFNAGVDPHADDRLGLLNLSDDGLAARERMIIAACRTAQVPLATVLGGGYAADADAVAARHCLVFEALADHWPRPGMPASARP